MINFTNFSFFHFSKKKKTQKKPGRWNAMHVRIAWEILHHQKKENPEKTSTTPNLTKTATAAAAAAAVAAATAPSPVDMHRPPSHIFPSSSVLQRPPELSTTFPPGLPGRPYDPATIPAGFLAGPTSHLGKFRTHFSFFKLEFH